MDWVKCMKADIVCLQETHASSHAPLKSGSQIAVTVLPLVVT